MTRKRLFHRECHLHVPFAEDLLEAFLVYVVNTGEARKVPGILVVVDGDGIALVKDDVACVGVDLLVVTRETARQVSHPSASKKFSFRKPFQNCFSAA